MYEHFFKRLIDFVLSLLALIVLSPLLLVLTIVGAIKMRGNPFFIQPRPGKDEKIFNLIKFRTMNNKKDKEGNLLSDGDRLNKYGKVLRSTSLDELPELINIIKGDMAIVGPRPQLVRDMVFMSKDQRKRHNVRQGLTGLAQVNGRNTILWEKKMEYDIRYIKNITLLGDLKIILKTLKDMFTRKKISTESLIKAENFGDYLFRNGRINIDEYIICLEKAENLIADIRR